MMLNSAAQMMNRFIHDDDGATAIEYALIAAILGVSIIGSVSMVTPEVNANFDRIADGFGTAP